MIYELVFGKTANLPKEFKNIDRIEALYFIKEYLNFDYNKHIKEQKRKC